MRPRPRRGASGASRLAPCSLDTGPWGGADGTNVTGLPWPDGRADTWHSSGDSRSGPPGQRVIWASPPRDPIDQVPRHAPPASSCEDAISYQQGRGQSTPGGRAVNIRGSSVRGPFQPSPGPRGNHPATGAPRESALGKQLPEGSGVV
jgi:hypothetical protein